MVRLHRAPIAGRDQLVAPVRVCSTCGREWAQPEGPYCTLDGGLLVAANVTMLAASDQHPVMLGPPVMPAISVEEELPVGTRVGEYNIEKRIGQGGMGVVYGARHPVIGKRVAIKVLNGRYSSDREAVERFVLEAQAVNQIGHSNIVDIFAFGTLPDGRQ